MCEQLMKIHLSPRVCSRFAVAHSVFILCFLEIDCLLFDFLNREFTKTIKRPFGVKYNPYTRSVQILKDTKSITSAMSELQHDLDVIRDALAKVSRQPIS